MTTNYIEVQSGQTFTYDQLTEGEYFWARDHQLTGDCTAMDADEAEAHTNQYGDGGEVLFAQDPNTGIFWRYDRA